MNKLRCSASFARGSGCPHYEDKNMVKDKVLEVVRVTHRIKHMTASRCFLSGPRYQDAEDSWACRVEVGDPIRSHKAG